MRSILSLSIALLFSSQTFAVGKSYTCYPELSGDEQEMVLSFDLVNQTASLTMDGAPVAEVQNASFVENGDVEDYGEAQVIVTSSTGKEIYLNRDYDEMILDIESLNLAINQSTFMCD